MVLAKKYDFIIARSTGKRSAQNLRGVDELACTLADSRKICARTIFSFLLHINIANFILFFSSTHAIYAQHPRNLYVCDRARGFNGFAVHFFLSMRAYYTRDRGDDASEMCVCA